jgi:MinD-like ATPase involved in chromosome partitioning or flagellar assembly
VSTGHATLVSAPPIESSRLDEARAVIAIGDPARERLVLQVLADAAEDGPRLRVVRRCLDAEDLLATIQGGDLDAAIVCTDLHGLGAEALRTLACVRIPMVLWGVTSTSSNEELRGALISFIPRDVDVVELRAAINGLAGVGGRLRKPVLQRAAVRRHVESAGQQAHGPTVPPALATNGAGTVFALVGPPGGPGVSTLSAGLATALSRSASTALVDLNLQSPGLAVALDLNPARNLYMVLHDAAGREDPSSWSDLLEAELQILHPSLPRAVVLAGVPGENLAAGVSPQTIQRLLRQLAQHERFIVADVGSDLDARSPAGSVHRAVLEAADRVLVVAQSDLVGLRRAAQLLECLRGLIYHHEQRLALILNRHQPRHHHDHVEVARALRTAVAAVIPDDPDGVQAALAAQQPLVAFGRAGRRSAARGLIDLARSLADATPSEDRGIRSGRVRHGFTWPLRLWPATFPGRHP